MDSGPDLPVPQSHGRSAPEILRSFSFGCSALFDRSRGKSVQDSPTHPRTSPCYLSGSAAYGGTITPASHLPVDRFELHPNPAPDPGARDPRLLFAPAAARRSPDDRRCEHIRHPDPDCPYANGTWDIPPWALPARRLFAATDGNGTWRWPPANQIWRASGRGIDVGRPPGTVAASVPDSWYFFSQSDHGRVVPTLSLRLASDVWSGDIRWVIATREGDPRAFPIRGVALSREPSAVLDTEAHPDVELLRDQLECADASRPRGGGGSSAGHAPSMAGDVHL